MKKNSMVLRALAIGFVLTMLTSCKDVDERGKSYICDISNIKVTTSYDLLDSVTFSAKSYGEVRFGDTQMYSSTNYDYYYLNFNGIKYEQPVYGRKGDVIGFDTPLQIYKVGNTYYTDDSSIESLTVDPNFESDTHLQ